LELTVPEKLTKTHDLSGFECGEKSINDYLVLQAIKAQEAKQAVVYVVCVKGTSKVKAFYTLSNGAVHRSSVVPKARQRNSPVQHPVTILGRMGVSIDAQGQGIAVDLLQDAIERALAASAVIGSTAMIVHPLNERLEKFYAKHAGFIPCPALSPITMMLALI